MFRNFKLKVGFIALIASLATLVYAQDIAVDAHVSSNKVSLGSSVKLAITVSGTQDVDAFQLPAIDGFDIRYVGPARSVSIVNGSYSSSITFNYSLLPMKAGAFQIPSFSIPVKGSTFTTQAIPIEVVDGGDASIAGATQTVSLKDRVFLVLSAPKLETYLNEGLPIKIMLFVNGIPVTDIQYPKLDAVGFTVGNFAKPSQYEQVIKGVSYDIVEFNTVVYPTRTGEITIGPATLDSNLIVQSNRSPSGMDSLFDDEFFSSFFQRQERRAITLNSQPITVKVKDVPGADKPKDFSGGVGEFNFDVSLSPTEVREGDPITLRMQVEGKGNLKAVVLPALKETVDFKLYEPNIREEAGAKVLEQVVIPTNKNVTEFPAINFSYFDTALGQYRTITKGPFPITITESAQKDDFKIIGLDQMPVAAPAQEETLGQDIVFIKSEPGALTRISRPFYTSILFYLSILLAVALWGGLYYFISHSQRLKSDEAYAKRFTAPRQARKDLAKVKGLLSANTQKQFYDAIYQTLQHYLSSKFHIPAGSVVAADIAKKIGDHLPGAPVIKDIESILEECDMVRYASSEKSQSQLAETYSKLESIIQRVEKHVK